MDRGHDPTTAVGGVIPAPPGSQATAEAHAALSPAGPRVPPCQCVDAIATEWMTTGAMSTNYYALIDECFDCGRADRVHICKSLISFHAPVVEDWSTANPVRTIFPSSWREWKRKLFTERIEVEDEYGERFTPDEFVALVGQTVLEARRRQYDWMAAHDPIRVSAGPEIGMTWLDPDGFTFTAREFS